MIHTKYRLIIGVFFVLFLLLQPACAATSWADRDDDSTTPASCAFIRGNGKGGNRGNLTKVLLPAQTNKNTDSDEVVEWFPCNSRNFIINDGTVYNANGKKVGDRDKLIEATTKTGVPITIAAHAEWTLNQSDKAMRLFFNVCTKYKCAGNKDEAGKFNYSTEGWNGMLGETMGITMDIVGGLSAFEIDDDIWLKQDPRLRKQLADRMSAQFADEMRKNFGYSEDLFCGSGTSSWDDPEKPGKGEFHCTPVRIVVDKVKLGTIDATNDFSPGVIALSKLKLENSKALYGPEGGSWRAMLDLLALCNKNAAACILPMGGGTSAPSVAIPAPAPTPAR